MLFRRHRSVVAWLLILVMSLTPALAYAQPPATRQPARSGAKAAIDLGYVTPETVAAVVVHPRRVLTAPEMEMLPLEVISAAGQKELGIDPVDVEQVLVIAESPQEGPPAVAIVLQFAKPLTQEKVFAPLWEQTTAGELEGQKYRQAQNPMALSIFRPNDRTLIVAHDPLLRRLLRQHGQPPAGEMSRVLGRIAETPDLMAVLLVAPLRPLIKGFLDQVPLPPPLAGVEKVPDLLSLVGIRVNVTGDTAMSLTLRAEDEAAAEQLDELIGRLLETARQAVLAEVSKQASSPDPVEQAAAQYAQRISTRLVKAFRPVRKGSALTLGTSGQGQLQVAAIGVLVALLLPAVQSARGAAQRVESNNNLKNIALALQNHHDVFKFFPAAYNADKAGKPLLSWRVHVLPFLEARNLYDKFHLDEPWDSEHNRALIPLMPKYFQAPGSKAEPGKTVYLGVRGANMMFVEPKNPGDRRPQGVSIQQVTDGTSNTVNVVEASDALAVTWTQPSDYEPDPENPVKGLVGLRPGGFLAALVDASVQFVSQTVAPEMVRRLFDRQDGKNVNLP